MRSPCGLAASGGQYFCAHRLVADRHEVRTDVWKWNRCLQADCVPRPASALVGRARRLSGVDGLNIVPTLAAELRAGHPSGLRPRLWYSALGIRPRALASRPLKLKIAVSSAMWRMSSSL